jgi:hypothetical protein
MTSYKLLPHHLYAQTKKSRNTIKLHSNMTNIPTGFKCKTPMLQLARYTFKLIRLNFEIVQNSHLNVGLTRISLEDTTGNV